MEVGGWTLLTASGVVSTHAVILGSVLVTGDGVGHADVTLYDGESASDRLITTIKTLQYRSGCTNFLPALETSRGLYIAFGSNVLHVLILFGESPER